MAVTASSLAGGWFGAWRGAAVEAAPFAPLQAGGSWQPLGAGVG